MSETLDAYIARQAATVGRRPQQVTRPVWVPHLPGAEEREHCLGIIPADGGNIGVTLLPDEQRLTTFNAHGEVLLWDLTTGEKIWKGSELHDAGALYSSHHSLSASPDGAYLAVSSSNNTIGILDVSTGYCILRLRGHSHRVTVTSWSPDGQWISSGDDGNTVRVWDAKTGNCVIVCEGHSGRINSLSWHADSHLLASGSEDKTVRIWGIDTGTCIHRYEGHDKAVISVSWSPHGHEIASGSWDDTLQIWNPQNGNCRLRINHLKESKEGNVLSAKWFRDGRCLAYGTDAGDSSIHVLDTQTGQELIQFPSPGDWVGSIAWSTAGGFLVSGHRVAHVRIWDTRHLLPSQTITTAINLIQPLSGDLQRLPAALAQLHRLGQHLPLALLRDLLALTGGRTVDGSLADLASAPGLPALIALRWPALARVGLVALLLHQLPLADWQPPAGISSTQLRDALTVALQGEDIPPEAPPPPLSLLRTAAQQIDDRLLALLMMLGPDAVAADPGLPLRLLPQVSKLPALSDTQRRLLGVRVRFAERGGQASGRSPGADRALVGGVESGRLRSDWGALLPSQLALDKQLLAYRYARGELLFRAREVAEPPQLRPTVLLLDTSPPTFGPVEAITRLAAFVVARTLHAAGVPVVLVTPGDRGEQVLTLERTADLIEVWTHRTLQSINAVRALRVASAVRANLSDGSGREPVILLLTQPWCGTEAVGPAIAELRGLFVQYPGQQVRPALAPQCARWQSVAAGQTDRLARILGELLG
jgi:hypothetical protein